jgi:hypothetical protein
MSKLVVFLPDGNTLDVPLKRERTTIGRRSANDICLPNLAVSGEHAVVVTILADSFLEDLNSTNGTLVNGEPVAKHFLRDRDEIDIGQHKLIYCVDDDARPASKKLEGMARVHERDFGGRVETAKPFVRGQAARRPTSEQAVDVAPAKAGAQGARGLSTPAVAPSVTGQAPAGSRARRQIELSIEPPEPVEESAAPPAVPRAPLNGPAVRVLTGARAGLAIGLSKAETTLGRPGVQVAAIVQADGRFRLKLVEGISPPALNGNPISADGADLAPGDIIEVASTQLEFLNPAKPAEPHGAG